MCRRRSAAAVARSAPGSRPSPAPPGRARGSAACSRIVVALGVFQPLAQRLGIDSELLGSPAPMPSRLREGPRRVSTFQLPERDDIVAELEPAGRFFRAIEEI